MQKPEQFFWVKSKMPQKLKSLEDIAANLYWIYGAETVKLFSDLDPDLWEKSRANPIELLQTISSQQINNALKNEWFMKHLNQVSQDYRIFRSMTAPWPKTDPKTQPPIAFFSTEYGLRTDLPIYAGGLGILAGDYLKSASDLGIPLIGVGLLYREGYFRQIIDENGRQREEYPSINLSKVPLELVLGPQKQPFTVKIDFPDRDVYVQVWKGKIGRVQLLLLDTDCYLNQEGDRRITDRLYSGDSEKRIQQEIVLGIGGIRTLETLGISPVIYHLNEGHSAFLALERIRQFMMKGLEFGVARELCYHSNIFTTHTPVRAGIDIFTPFLMDKYFTGYYQGLNLSRQEFLALGRTEKNNDQEPFNMAVLAIRLSRWINGVSQLHGRVARKMWQSVWPLLSESELPITSITNGIHVNSWIGLEIASVFDRYLGQNWRNQPQRENSWAKIELISEEELWEAHQTQKHHLIQFIRNRMKNRLKDNQALPGYKKAIIDSYLDPNVLTVGFARRFAAYKRPTLIFKDPERLLRLMKDPSRPIQLIFTGKAHPQDEIGKDFIQKVNTFAQENHLEGRLIFIEDYDMEVGRYLVQGVDLWLGNPRRPLEASSTSGMKAVINGVLHCSTLDGWWNEAWQPDLGWRIGYGDETEDIQALEDCDARSLYTTLEEEVIPLYYKRDLGGVPRGWVAKMKKAISTFAPYFNSHRMIEEYYQKIYLPAAHEFLNLAKENYQKAEELSAWQSKIFELWDEVEIEKVVSDCSKDNIFIGDSINVQVFLKTGRILPEDLRVELIWGPVDSGGEIEMSQSTVAIIDKYQEVKEKVFVYSGRIEPRCSGLQRFRVRVYPYRPELGFPQRLGLILQN